MEVLLNAVGAAIILGASSLAGIYYGNLETYRTKELLELKKALYMLRSQIDYAKAPLQEAMQHIAQRLERPSCAGIFGMMAELLLHERNSQVVHMWQAAVEHYAAKLYLIDEDIESLAGLGAGLGDVSEVQLANINMVVAYIDEKLESLTDSRDSKKRLYRSLGVLCGALIVIIFI